MITIERITAFIWLVLPFRWLYSWIRRILKGYFPWTKTPPIASLDLAAQTIHPFVWRKEKTDWVQHPLQTQTTLTGDCDDASAWWITVGRERFLHNNLVLYPIGMLSIIWQYGGHSIALFRDTDSRIYIASNARIEESIFYWPRERHLIPTTLRAIARQFAPNKLRPIFYCLHKKDSLLWPMKWGFM